MAGEVTVKWDQAAVDEFERDPEGVLGRDLLEPIADYVALQAQKLALRRTGRMASEIHAEPGADEAGQYADIVSPVDYARFHEGTKVRDRGPHRSLIPALTTIDIMLSGGGGGGGELQAAQTARIRTFTRARMLQSPAAVQAATTAAARASRASR